MLSSREHEIQKFIQKNKKLQRQIAEYNDKKLLKAQKDDFQQKAKETRKEYKTYLDKRQGLFSSTNLIESQLIHYIALLNAKMYKNRELSNKEINSQYHNNLSLIKEFQEYIKFELNQTKNELEAEVIDSFAAQEKEQQEMLNNKIAEQIVLFEQMDIAKDELSKIKDDFVNINKLCEKGKILQDKLTLEIKVKKTENNALKKIVKELTEIQNDLLNKYNAKYNTMINISSISDSYIYDNNNEINSQTDQINDPLTPSKINEDEVSLPSDLTPKQAEKVNEENNSQIYLEQVIEYLTNKNEELKHKALEQGYMKSMMLRNENNMKILLEKCIEDLNYEYKRMKNALNRASTSTTRINAGITPLHTFKTGINLYKNVKLQQKIDEVESKLYKFSYILDNCFIIAGNTKVRNRNILNKSNSMALLRSGSKKNVQKIHNLSQ